MDLINWVWESNIRVTLAIVGVLHVLAPVAAAILNQSWKWAGAILAGVDTLFSVWALKLKTAQDYTANSLKDGTSTLDSRMERLLLHNLNLIHKTEYQLRCTEMTK
ncbi:unnamed protein product [Tilletia controversa]|uniref:Uncharacterized protein n=1 Tax=Tilletia caries TaxID=13290 RepID=A0A177T0D9_9BASI|nr:hypothetical protein CF335_g9576 [Tilletia laevis]KAE8195767.1 hypothetical protein CF328_g4330 [Tilletia controversa]KAE8255382.1 hypothetical protein A4X03_0g5575 [Tilletia caries]KAE8187834.1 hypothetical protein CF336_g6410 [Tilletia laevis]CAD6916579.1 unnamed protein product [Tilletia caries]